MFDVFFGKDDLGVFLAVIGNDAIIIINCF